MTSRDFCYWLQGFFEIKGPDTDESLSHGQVEIIKSHLAMVFKHEIDPSMGDQKHQDELNLIHPQTPLQQATPSFGVLSPNNPDLRFRC